MKCENLFSRINKNIILPSAELAHGVEKVNADQTTWGSAVQSIVSLTSSLVLKMLTSSKYNI